MQAKQIKALIDCYGAALSGAGATETASWMSRIGDALSAGGAKATGAFLGSVEKTGFDPAAATGPTLGDAAPAVKRLAFLLAEAGAKKAAVTDLELLIDLAHRHSGVSLAAFASSAKRSVASASRGKAKSGAPAVDTKQLIESYLQRLEAALGNDPTFRVIHRELAANTSSIGRNEIVEIASRFFEPLAPSTTRSKALQKILYRHEKLLESRAASKSIGGRAA